MEAKLKRVTQRISATYLEQTQAMTATQIADFISDYQKVFYSDEGKKKLISMRVPEKLLESFKVKSKLSGRRYQNQIVDLMRAWLTQECK